MKIKFLLTIVILAAAVLCSTGAVKAATPFTVSCSANAQEVLANRPVVWTATVSALGTYNFSWTGTDNLSSIDSPVNTRVYNKKGKKTATVTATSNGVSKKATCSVIINQDVRADAACIGVAVLAREDRLGRALETYTDDLQDAYRKRADDLRLAYVWNLTGLQGIKDLKKVAWTNFNTSIKNARNKWQTTRNEWWAYYRVAGNLCGAPSGTGDGSFSGYEVKGN